MRNYFSELMNKIKGFKMPTDEELINPCKKEVYPYQILIEKYADLNNLESTLIRALIQTESSFNERAVRYEPQFYKTYIKDKPNWVSHPYYNKPKILCSSVGLTQILPTTAMEYGIDFSKHRKGIEILYEPEMNIMLGTKILKRKILKYGLERGILAYNSGSPRTLDPKKEHNYVYLQKIAKNYKKFSGTNQTILKHV